MAANDLDLIFSSAARPFSSMAWNQICPNKLHQAYNPKIPAYFKPRGIICSKLECKHNQFSYFTLIIETATHFVCCSVFRSSWINNFLGFLLFERGRILWGCSYGLQFVLLILPQCSFLMHSPPFLYKLVLLMVVNVLRLQHLLRHLWDTGRHTLMIFLPKTLTCSGKMPKK